MKRRRLTACGTEPLIIVRRVVDETSSSAAAAADDDDDAGAGTDGHDERANCRT